MKRLIDIFVALFGLMIFSLPMIVLMVIIRIKLGSPIFFRQIRPGLNAQPFEVIKFRTMTNRHDANGMLLSDSERLTRFGRLLRSTSLDEIPQLWNVLRGDISLVGPRPLLMQYLPLYSDEQSRRHEVRPGITGWAQVNGRNGLSWEDKFRLDVWYVDHHNLWLDIKILLLTVRKVLVREGISAKGERTMSEFLGSANSSVGKE